MKYKPAEAIQRASAPAREGSGSDAVPSSIPILMYHSVDTVCAPAYRPYAVSPELFTRHMRLLRDAGYKACSTSELLALRNEREVAKPLVGLTFDDGLRDFLTGALPVLRSLSFSATLYVVSGYIGSTSRWLGSLGEGDRPMLSWSELQEVARAGIECGAHTVSHPELDILPSEVARREVFDSKHAIEDGLGCEVRAFAYPHGYASQRTRELVREAGFGSGCRVRHALSSGTEDPFSLSRIIVTPELEPKNLLTLFRGIGVPVAPRPGTLKERTWRLARYARTIL